MPEVAMLRMLQSRTFGSLNGIDPLNSVSVTIAWYKREMCVCVCMGGILCSLINLLFFRSHSASRTMPAVSFPPPATEAPLLPLPLSHPPQSDPMAPFNHYYHQAESSVEARAAIRYTPLLSCVCPYLWPIHIHVLSPRVSKGKEGIKLSTNTVCKVTWHAHDKLTISTSDVRGHVCLTSVFLQKIN